MTSIDRALMEKRRQRNKPASIFYIFGQMVTGKLDQQHGYLNGLHAPISFPAAFLILGIVIMVAAIWLFGAKP